ncbi:MAG: hypothetical protein JXR85_01475, partial [Deltaproteobacteria bacterium]|nr:hypothetical protein [Deltaproteobacteria bacterium]
MKTLHRFYNMKAGLIDLGKLSAEVIPLDYDILSERIGGAAVNMALFDRYGQGDPIVLGVGPLTGSFAPASCLMVATFRSPKSGRITHVPLMFRTGPDMKFAGFDYLVIIGSAEEPRVLFFTEGRADFLPAGHMAGLNISENMRAMKREWRHVRSVVLTGPAADKGLSCASVSIGTGGSLDKAGLASLMAAKNLKGFIFHGIDGIPFGEKNLALGDEMMKGLAAGSKANRGFLSVLEKCGAGDSAAGSLRNYRMKHMACYHCPSPCMSHVTVSMPGTSRGKEAPE